MAWFRLNIGRSKNADPKWLIPLICRLGHVTKKDIGSIRIFDRETKFEITREAEAKFLEAVKTATMEGDMKVEPSSSPGPRAPREAGDRPAYAKPERRPDDRPAYGKPPRGSDDRPYSKGPRGSDDKPYAKPARSNDERPYSKPARGTEDRPSYGKPPRGTGRSSRRQAPLCEGALRQAGLCQDAIRQACGRQRRSSPGQTAVQAQGTAAEGVQAEGLVTTERGT